MYDVEEYFLAIISIHTVGVMRDKQAAEARHRRNERGYETKQRKESRKQRRRKARRETTRADVWQRQS